MTIAHRPAIRTIFRIVLGLGLLWTVALQPAPALAADLHWKAERRAAHDRYGPYYRHHRYYREYDECRVGWWRVRSYNGTRRPSWGVRCR